MLNLKNYLEENLPDGDSRLPIKKWIKVRHKKTEEIFIITRQLKGGKFW